MIVVWGPKDDPPAESVLNILRQRSVDVVGVDDGDLATLRYDVRVAAATTGWLEFDGREVSIDQIDGIYLRPCEAMDGAVVAAAAMTLLAVASCAPTTVINRPGAGRSNWSKPFQLSLIGAAGFAVPETLVTTDPATARAFLAKYGRIVYKSISGVRSIVATLEGADAERLDGVRTGPVQLQRWVDGRDVRVHVVGDRWFATAIESEATDYRYAASAGADVAMTPCEIPEEIGHRLVALSRSMGLLVSGADFRVTPNHDWICFEVNPSPGFTFYEEATHQPIAAAIADLLVGGVDSGRPAPSDDGRRRPVTRRRNRRPDGAVPEEADPAAPMNESSQAGPE